MKSQRITHVAIIAAVTVLLLVVLWLDIATGIWQEYVILSGLAAGLITFALTVLVLDRLIAKSTAQRWAPVTTLALTDILHVLADDERSEISRGRLVPRVIRPIGSGNDTELDRSLERVRSQVVDERRRLSNVLAKWSAFLASSSEHQDVLTQVALIALQLDRIRDAAINVEHDVESTQAKSMLDREISAFNEHVSNLIDRIEERMSTDSKR